MPARKSTEDRWRRARRFVADFTEGLDQQSVRRLFDRDATQAFRALAGQRDDEARLETSLKRFLSDVRDVFLGFVFKLSPARRLLFTVALFCPLLGLLDFELQVGPTYVHVDFFPFWFLVGYAGLILLLALELVDRLRVRDELEVARDALRRSFGADLFLTGKLSQIFTRKSSSR